MSTSDASPPLHRRVNVDDVIMCFASAPVEVIAPEGAYPRLRGVRIHRVRPVRPDEVTTLDNIPITTVPRTLHDLAGVAGERELERLLAQALTLGLTSRNELLSHLERASSRPGISRLRALIERETPPALTRSKAEERFRALIRRAQLPTPAVNASVLGHRVDFLWVAQQLVVEIDGYAFHSEASEFESDRRRDAELAAAGVRVVRVTWRQLVNEPEAVLVRLALALARAPDSESIKRQ